VKNREWVGKLTSKVLQKHRKRKEENGTQRTVKPKKFLSKKRGKGTLFQLEAEKVVDRKMGEGRPQSGKVDLPGRNWQQVEQHDEGFCGVVVLLGTKKKKKGGGGAGQGPSLLG